LCANGKKISTSSSDFLEIAQKAPLLRGFLASLVMYQKKTPVRAVTDRCSGGNDAGWQIFGGSSLVAAG
jgi:hypothetical protein